MPLVRRRLLVALLVPVVFAFCGCGVRYGKISGTVKLKGQPLQEGILTVMGSNGEVKSAWVTNGNYSVDHVPFGDCVITIQQSKEEDSTGDFHKSIKTHSSQVAEKHEKQEKPEAKAKGPPIPKTYQERGSTPLKCTLDKKEITYDIVLE